MLTIDCSSLFTYSEARSPTSSFKIQNLWNLPFKCDTPSCAFLKSSTPRGRMQCLRILSLMCWQLLTEFYYLLKKNRDWMWWSDANIEDGKSGRGKDLTKEDRRWQLQKVSNEILSNTLLGSIIFLFQFTEKYSFMFKVLSRKLLMIWSAYLISSSSSSSSSYNLQRALEPIAKIYR